MTECNRGAGEKRRILYELMQVSIKRFGRVICWCCKRRIRMKINLDRNQDRYATMDHIVPLINDGVDDWINWQLLCNQCNSSKGDKTIDYRDEKLFILMGSNFHGVEFKGTPFDSNEIREFNN